MKDVYFTVHDGRTLERIRFSDDGSGREGQVFNMVDGKWDWRPSPSAEKIYFWDYLDWSPCSEEEAQKIMKEQSSEK